MLHSTHNEDKDEIKHMVHSNTSFGKLKKVVVGRELQLPKRIVDISFKYFYKEALRQGLYNSAISEYKISQDIIDIRIAQLDNLEKTLQSFGIKTYRPTEVKKVQKIVTPSFESEASSASNVRDLTLIYNDKIVETPCFIRNRYFENMNMANIFNEVWKGGQWVKAPNTKLSESSMDLDPWDKKGRDFSNIDKRYEMAIDAAQFLRIGKDVIVNVSTYNHWLGYEWVKSLFPQSTFWPITCCDNHIDGMLICLKPGAFLASPAFDKNLLPQKFKSWTIIVPEDVTHEIDATGMTDVDIKLASSRGMDINVLSIDEHTVFVNKKATGVEKALEKNGFDVVPISLDYGEIFAGGIHCSTLDIEREDEYTYYD